METNLDRQHFNSQLTNGGSDCFFLIFDDLFSNGAILRAWSRSFFPNATESLVTFMRHICTESHFHDQELHERKIMVLRSLVTGSLTINCCIRGSSRVIWVHRFTKFMVSTQSHLCYTSMLNFAIYRLCRPVIYSSTYTQSFCDADKASFELEITPFWKSAQDVNQNHVLWH